MSRLWLLVFGATLAVYVFALAPDMGWLDSSELAAAAWGLGIAHPPGHPLAVLIGKACTILPFGSIAFKVGLASALCGAAAAAQVASLGAIVSRRARGSDALSIVATRPALRAGAQDELAGGAAGLAFGLGYAAAFQAVRPEVYALHALLAATAAVELLRWDERGDRRRLYLGSLAIGLMLSNHTLLGLAGALALLVLLLRRPGPGFGAAARRVVLAGALGLSMFAVLPIRAQAHPLVDWGAPDDPARFFWLVSARAFQKSLARSGGALDVGFALAAELGGVGLLIGLAGLLVLLRQRALRRVGMFLTAATLLDAAAPAAVGFDVANPDAYGYLAPAVAFVAVMGCALLGALATLSQKGARVVAAACGLAALFAGGLAWRRFAREAAWEPRTLLAPFQDEAPPRGTLVTSYFQTIFGLYYLRAAEGQRPDVTLVHRHFLAYPGYRDELLRRVPEAARFALARDIDPDALPAGAVVEYDLDLPDRLAPRARVVKVPAPSSPSSIESSDPETRRFTAWQTFLAAHRACRVHDEPARALAAARARLGDDPELAKLADLCGQNL